MAEAPSPAVPLTDIIHLLGRGSGIGSFAEILFSVCNAGKHPEVLVTTATRKKE